MEKVVEQKTRKEANEAAPEKLVAARKTRAATKMAVPVPPIFRAPVPQKAPKMPVPPKIRSPKLPVTQRVKAPPMFKLPTPKMYKAKVAGAGSGPKRGMKRMGLDTPRPSRSTPLPGRAPLALPPPSQAIIEEPEE